MGQRFSLPEIEQRVCDIASAQLGIAREKVVPSSRIVEDLHCDSLDLVELFVEVEQAFEIKLPEDRDAQPAYKAVFTRSSFRLADLAELVYLQQGSAGRDLWQLHTFRRSQPIACVPFTQLGGRTEVRPPLRFDALGDNRHGFREVRRLTDGMRCVWLPAARVVIGSLEGLRDEQPQHAVELEAFVIDAEPVSTTAYCRFLNSLGEIPETALRDWFMLATDDDRVVHQLIEQTPAGWQPVSGAESWPMVLVSWFGANAYALWANGHDWQAYRNESGAGNGVFLPSEAQWEYAARGATYREFPWGDQPATIDRLQFAQHERGQTYTRADLPLIEVNAMLGMSPFGMHHMAGNVWQWCRDWYDPRFYSKPTSQGRDPVNLHPSQARSERGGSWIGSAALCRSSFRRGRPPLARGRCLGFRCVTPAVLR